MLWLQDRRRNRRGNPDSAGDLFARNKPVPEDIGRHWRTRPDLTPSPARPLTILNPWIFLPLASSF